MFALTTGVITINNIAERSINMFTIIGITIVLVIATIVAAFTTIALTNYTIARAIVDAIPLDSDAIERAIAHIPGAIKRWAEDVAMCGTVLALTAWKTVTTATKEAWHNLKIVAHDTIWAIGAIGWLNSIVFKGVCDDVATMIANGNTVIDAAVERFKRLRGMIADIIGNTKIISADIHRITKTVSFYVWRVAVGIKDAINLALDFAYAAWRYAKAHTPSVITKIQVTTWSAIVGIVNTITNAINAITNAINTIARFVRETIGIFAAIARLFSWIFGGIGLDANKALTKVANKF